MTPLTPEPKRDRPPKESVYYPMQKALSHYLKSCPHGRADKWWETNVCGSCAILFAQLQVGVHGPGVEIIDA